MESINNSWIKHNWLQKMVALVSAILIWIFVSQSIVSTKTIPNVPVRIFDLPPNKTISGLLPNGLYSKRMTLTLQGTKDVIDQLEPGDFEVVLDAKRSSNEWVIQLTKKDLKSLNPEIDLSKHITDIKAPEWVIKLSKLTTSKVMVNIYNEGKTPKGYHFLDIFPHHMMQEVSGPEEEIAELVKEGLEYTVNLSNVTKDELDALATTLDDEVSYKIPSSWKEIAIPCLPFGPHPLNDSIAEQLTIDFLKDTLIPLNQDLPISVFYPLESSAQLNPKTAPVKINGLIKESNDIPYLALPLYINGASKRFLDIVRSQLTIIINAQATNKGDKLSWNLELVNPKAMEDRFVSLMKNEINGLTKDSSTIEQHEKMLRSRFREYLQNIRLYTDNQRKLSLDCKVIDKEIEVLANVAKLL
ncbi:hypothetical protein N9Y92_00635 [Chlamydiales bacterium]|nr:hypothetical protein [Chlamydiales bacterium]